MHTGHLSALETEAGRPQVQGHTVRTTVSVLGSNSSWWLLSASRLWVGSGLGQQLTAYLPKASPML